MISATEAQLLLKAGRTTEAEDAFRKVLEQDPNNVQALNVVALKKFRERDFESALLDIESALRTEPENPITMHNRGRILNELGRHDLAADSQRAALLVAPEFHAARLFLGHALELGGKSHLAIVSYARALHDAQMHGRWMNESTTPPAFRSMVEHAALEVRRGRRSAIDRLLSPLIDKFGRSALARIDQSIRCYFNEMSRPPTDPRQQSTFFQIAGIPAYPYLNLGLFDWIDFLQSQTHQIRDELLMLMPRAETSERVFTSDELEAAHLRGYRPSWNGFYFYRHGERRIECAARCPITASALDSLPLCRIRDHGPEVLFSVFTPGTHLLPHRGVTNARVVAHLPLIVPPNCALRVGGELHHWREGEVVVFDDTYEHEAWNRSDQIRVVLIFDIWSPFLTDVERTAIALVIEDVGDFRKETEAVG